MVNEPDPIVVFSHRLAQVKFVILEIIIFVGFLLWASDELSQEIKKRFPGTRAETMEDQSSPTVDTPSSSKP